MSVSCDFTYTENASISWFRTNKLITPKMKIKNLNKFRDKNSHYSVIARRRFSLDGSPMLFLEDRGGTIAMPNKEMFLAIDRWRAIHGKAGLSEADAERYYSVDDILKSDQALREQDEDELLQLTPAEEVVNEQIDAKMKVFIEKLGFTIEEKSIIHDADGNSIDATAKVDMLNKMVEVADGRVGIDTLPEEAAHLLTLLLRDNNDSLYDELLDGIELTDEYIGVKKEYVDVYGDNEALYKLEAVGKIIAKEIVSQENKSLLRKIFSAIKRFFGKVIQTPFQKAAFMILNADTSRLSTRVLSSSEALFQLSRDDISKKFLETNKRLEIRSYDITDLPSRVYKGILDKIDRYHDRLLNVPLGKLVSDKVSTAFVKRFGPTKARELYERNDNVIYRQVGTLMRDASAKIIDYIVNDVGDKDKIRKDSTLNDLQFKNLYDGMTKVVDQSNELQKTIDDKQKPTFHIAQKLHDEEKDIAGTADLVVMFSDSSVSLFMMEFKAYTRRNSAFIGGERVATKELVTLDTNDSYEMQVYEYVTLLEEVYKIYKIRQSRIVPIGLSYRYDSDKNLTNKITQLDIGVDANQFLQQVPLYGELPTMKSLNDGIEAQKKIQWDFREAIRVEKDYDKRESLKVQFNKISEGINALLVQGDIRTLLNDIRFLVHQIYGDGKTGALFTENDPSSTDYISIKDLGKISEQLAAHSSVLLNIDEYIEGLSDNPEMKTRTERSRDILYRMIGHAQQSIKDKIRERTVNIAKGEGHDIDKAFKPLSNYDLSLGTTSEINHPIFQTSWNYISRAQDQTRRKVNKVYEEMKVLNISIQNWGKRNGYKAKEVFSLLIDGDMKNLVQMFDQRLYKDRDRAIDGKEVRWLRQHWNVTDKFKNELDVRRKRFKKSTDANFYDIPGDESGSISLDRSSVRESEMRKWEEANDINNILFWTNKEYTKLNIELKKEYYEQYYHKKYKFIRDNKPLLDYYNYYISRNKEFNEIYGNVNDTFVANVHRTGLDSVMFGTNKFKGLFKSLINSLSIHQDGSLGQVDPITGEVKNRIPVLFTNAMYNSRGEKDYSNKSTDLSKVMLLFAETIYNYEAMQEVEVVMLTLQDTLEENLKGELLKDASGKDAKDRLGRRQKVKKAEKTVKHFKTLLKYHIYGQKMQTKDKKISALGHNFSGIKVAGMLRGYYGVKVLGASIIAPVAAFTAGFANIYFEASKGQFFNLKDAKISIKRFLRRDRKAMMLIKYFEPNQEDLTHRKANNLSVNKVTKYITTANMYKGFTLADEKLDFFSGNSIFESHGIDADGNFVKRKKGDGLKSLYSVSKIINDKLVIEGVDDNVYNQIRRLIRAVAGSTKGQMSDEETSAWAATLLGKSALQFRSWMPRLLAERFGDMRYSPDTRTYHKGRYRVFASEVLAFNEETNNLALATFRMVTKLGRVAMSTFGLDYNWNTEENKQNRIERSRFQFNKFKEINKSDPSIDNLTFDQYLQIQEGQMKAIAAELRVMLLVLASLFLLGRDWDDDGERDFRKYFVTRKLFQVMNRARTELSFFVNPMEFMNLAKTALPVMGLMQDVTKLVTNTIDESIDLLTGRDDAYDTSPWFYYGINFLPPMDEVTSFFEVFAQDKRAER